MATNARTYRPLTLSDPDQWIEYIESINQQIGRATTVQRYHESFLTSSAPKSLVYVDLADVPGQPNPPGMNYALAFQGVDLKKLAYAIVTSSPQLADELMAQLAAMIDEYRQIDVIPRDHIND